MIVAGVAAGLLTLLAGLGGTWPFHSRPAPVERFDHPSAWQYFFSDTTTLGFVRLAIVVASVFIIVSVVALLVAGRWMSGFGGLSVDEKESSRERVSWLEHRLEATEVELEKAIAKHKEAEDWASSLAVELDRGGIESEHPPEASAAED